jgi:hydrogenase maturation protease
MTSLNWLVAGIGNPLQGADGFGPAVIEQLRRREMDLPGRVELVDAHTDLLSCLDRFGACDGVVLVDALLGPGPRRVMVVGEQTFAEWDASSTGAHGLSALMAVQLFRRLQPGASTRFLLVGLVVQDIAPGSPLLDGEVDAGAQAVTRIIAGRA